MSALVATRTRPPRPLKPYQVELLTLVARDFTIHRIARAMGLPQETAQSRVNALHRRYGTSTRLALVLSAMARGDLPVAETLARYRVPADAKAAV